MFGLKEKVEAVKAIPDQMRMTFTLAAIALVVAIIAFGMSVAANGVRHAN